MTKAAFTAIAAAPSTSALEPAQTQLGRFPGVMTPMACVAGLAVFGWGVLAGSVTEPIARMPGGVPGLFWLVPMLVAVAVLPSLLYCWAARTVARPRTVDLAHPGPSQPQVAPATYNGRQPEELASALDLFPSEA